MIKTTHILFIVILSTALALSGASQQESSHTADASSLSKSGDVQPLIYDYPFEEHLKVYAKRKYALLLITLQDRLSESDSARLEGILVNRELVVNSRNRPKSEKYLIQNREKFDLQIRAELGDDIANAVTTYLKNSPTRSFLSRVNMLLVYAGDPLDAKQIDNLCLIFAAHPSPKAPRNAESATEIEDYLKQRMNRDHMIVIEAGESLSPVQLKVLSEEMEFQLSYTKLGMARTSAPRRSN